LEKCKNITIIDNRISIKSSLKEEQRSEIVSMVDALIASMPDSARNHATSKQDVNDIHAMIEPKAMFKLTYGLFVLIARDGDKDNGCIINTITQITENPLRISVALNKSNFTHDMISKTGEFNISILTESVPFRIFEQFGFASGKDTDKFAESDDGERSVNGIRYLSKYTNGLISAKVTEVLDCGTHTLFIADVVQTLVLSNEPSTTYQYYLDYIKPKPQVSKEKKKGFVCRICGYEYEGDVLPDDIICPLCKHGSEDFESI
jgi:flavin reductase (DIM6/NTAB) family NADH-FMN oxidoreductase RutF